MSSAEIFIKNLKLEKLEPEGGYFRRIYESDDINPTERRFEASILEGGQVSPC